MVEYGPEYQEGLIGQLTNRRFMEQTARFLSTDMFDPQYEALVKRCLTLFKDKGEVLNKRQFSQLCRGCSVSLNGDVQGSASFDQEEAVAFIKHRSVRSGLSRAHVLLESGEFEKAVKAVEDSRSYFPVINADVAPDIFTSNRLLQTRQGIQSTGMPTLDTDLRGGVAAGDLAVVLAETSGGKTSLLVWLGSHAAGMGRKVYHVTLETPEWDVVAKYKSCLTRSETPSKAVWKSIRGNLKQKGGWIRVREHPPHTVSVLDLDNEMPSDTDLLIVDYADYLRPPSRSQGVRYMDLGDIYTEMKRVAMERSIPVWTATQANREGYSVLMISTKDVAGSLDKMMVADQVLSINQDDENRKPSPSGDSVGILYVAKNRHGPPLGEFPITVNFAKCLFMAAEKR